MQTFWSESGFEQLVRDAHGWLRVTPEYLRLFLARPELAPVAESCAAERALHAALLRQPQQNVAEQQLQLLQDPDARDNYRMFLQFRDALIAAGTLEACYLALMRQRAGSTPPLFVDALAHAVLRNILDACTDPYAARAGEMLFRAQRVTLQDGRVLCGDRDTLDMLNQTAGLGEVGRLLLQSGAALPSAELQVLGPDNAHDYWAQAEKHLHVLDLTHETSLELSHGLTLKLARRQSGLKALAGVLERWTLHLLGVQVRIQPRQRIDDPAWRWHIGLDPQSSAVLNALYLEQPVEPAQMQRMLSLFQLDFADSREMRADCAGRPVYLGLAMDAEQVLKLKPQNLLLNLPLAVVS